MNGFFRCDVIDIDDVIDIRFCLRQQMWINYISFESSNQEKANDVSCTIVNAISSEISTFNMKQNGGLGLK